MSEEPGDLISRKKVFVISRGLVALWEATR